MLVKATFLLLFFCILVNNKSIAYCKSSSTTQPLLTPGQEIVSDNGKYSLTLQEDGNLVLYANNTDVLWSSRTAKDSGSTDISKSLWFTPDGSLTLFNSKEPRPVTKCTSHFIWCTGHTTYRDYNTDYKIMNTQNIWHLSPNNTGYQPQICVENDGNLRISSINNSTIWETKTSGQPCYFWIADGVGYPTITRGDLITDTKDMNMSHYPEIMFYHKSDIVANRSYYVKINKDSMLTFSFQNVSITLDAKRYENSCSLTLDKHNMPSFTSTVAFVDSHKTADFGDTQNNIPIKGFIPINESPTSQNLEWAGSKIASTSTLNGIFN